MQQYLTHLFHFVVALRLYNLPLAYSLQDCTSTIYEAARTSNTPGETLVSCAAVAVVLGRRRRLLAAGAEEDVCEDSLGPQRGLEDLQALLVPELHGPLLERGEAPDGGDGAEPRDAGDGRHACSGEKIVFDLVEAQFRRLIDGWSFCRCMYLNSGGFLQYKDYV